MRRCRRDSMKGHVDQLDGPVGLMRSIYPITHDFEICIQLMRATLAKNTLKATFKVEIKVRQRGGRLDELDVAIRKRKQPYSKMLKALES